MILKLWREIIALWWAAWSMWQAARWTFGGVPQDEIERRIKERMAEVLGARKDALT